MHGTYSSTKTKNEYALAGVNTLESVVIRLAESEAWYNILIVEITASFAANPDNMLTAASGVPKPHGVNIGAIKVPIIPNIL